jgi:phytoene dehydrogenase-like protein
MDSQLHQADVVIIGGGLAGLSAATYLGRAGLSVTLYEKSAGLGGKAVTQRYEGYSINRGIHALYCGGATEQVLQELGIAYSGHSPKSILGLREGKLQVAPISVPTLLRTGLLSIADKLELLGLFTGVGKLKAQDFSRVSVQAWLEQTVKRPKVRQFMEANARTAVYSDALDLVSAEVFITKMQLKLKSPIVYLDGGWQSLVNGLRNAAQQAGVHIITGSRVEGVEHQAGRLTGIRLAGGKVVPAASAVIIATAPKDALKLVDRESAPDLHRVVEANVPAQIACLDVALSRLPDPGHPIVQDLEAPRFLTVQSLFSKVAPQAGAMVYTFKQLNPNRPTDPHQDERELEDLLDTAQPGWRDVVVKRVFMPRIDAVGILPTAEGGGFAGRPGPTVAGLANLYLAGDWIGSEGFLADASLASARQVAQLILQAEKTRAGERAVSEVMR